MKTHIPDSCGNSPRSLLAIEIAVNLAANKYDKLEPLLAEDFSWSVVDKDKVIPRSKLKAYMENAIKFQDPVERFDVITSISHGKYAAVSSRAYMPNGVISNSHDLYEFTSASSSAKLIKITSYTVDSKP